MTLPALIPTAKQLNHLPIVAHALNRLGVRRIVDELVPKDPRSRVSTGECIEVLVTAILLGHHTLYRVADLLRPYDLRVAFGFELADASHFNDERLAKALTDVFHVAGVDATNSAMLLAAIREYELAIRRAHLDTSSVSVHGEYAGSSPPIDPDDSRAVPHVTRGYSKDRRPDLKQIVYGLSVNEDGVPVFGRVSSGNRADSLELRHMLERLRKALPQPEDVLYVGDSKLFSAETLAQTSAYGLKFVTLMPRSFGLWETVYRRFLEVRGEVPILKTKALGELDEEAEVDSRPRHFWRGRSFDVTHEFVFDGSDYAVALRLLVVESDALRARKEGAIRRRETKERLRLVKLQGTHEKRVYSCQEDAERAMERLRQQAVEFHTLECSLVTEQQPVKRAQRGRPPKDEVPQLETLWKVVVTFAADAQRFEDALRQETCFVLATNVPVAPDGHREAADRETLRAYDEQDSVERAFRWAKRPLRFAPVFLERDDRIAALGLVYVIALMVYALIQRDVRQRLQAHETTMPGNKRWTARPTAEVLFRLFENVQTVTLGGLDERVYVTGLNTEQVRILDLLGIDLRSRPGVEFGEVRTPVPGERAFKPVPRVERQQPTIS
ncbi:MAG: IS1634 family transposase [Thermoanaerobaculia bacterium]